MKRTIIITAVVALLIFVIVSCTLSEFAWTEKEKDSTESVRQVIGLPSIAVGNLNPSARNPGLELLCTSIYDLPGGYCNYFTSGVSYIYFNTAKNVTVSVNR